jgi:hypothetical protein
MASLLDEFEAEQNNASESLLDQFEAEQTAKPKRTIAGTLNDTLITGLKGAIAVPEMAIGLADIFTGGRTGKGAERVGFKPAEAKAILDSYKSEAQKAADAEVGQADGFFDTLKALKDNPSVIAMGGIESLPMMGAGGVIGRGITALAPKVSSMVAGAIGEGAAGAGSAAENLRAQTEDGYLTGKQQIAAAGTGLALTGVSRLGGKVADELGIGDIDTLAAGGAQQVGNKGLIRKMGEGAVVEGTLEEAPQSALEKMLENYGLGKEITEGVGNASAVGFATGAPFGAIAQVANGSAPQAPAPEQFNLGETLAALSQANELVQPVEQPTAPAQALTISQGEDADDATAAAMQAAYDAEPAAESSLLSEFEAEIQAQPAEATNGDNDQASTPRLPVSSMEPQPDNLPGSADNLPSVSDGRATTGAVEAGNEQSISTGIDSERDSALDQPAVKAKPARKAPRKNTLLATLRNIGGISLADKMDVTGEDKAFAPGGYNQVFTNKAKASLRGQIESGNLDDFLPPAMRLSTQSSSDQAYDSAEAYDYIAERIRNGDRVLPYDVEEEIKASQYYANQDVNADIEAFDNEDEINALLAEAGYDERESNTTAQDFEQGSTDRNTVSGERDLAREASQYEPAPIATQTERQEVRPLVEQLSKRRAAANQLGKSKQFDTALNLAKEFLNGGIATPAKFKNAATMFANDKPTADIFNALYQQAKAPAKETKQAKNAIIETYKDLIGKATSIDELQTLAGEIQSDNNLTDSQAQALDDLVFEAQDKFEEIDTEPTQSNADLLGEDTSRQQAIADAERAKDTKRNSGKDNADDFTLSGSDSDADQAAAAGAQPLFSATKESGPRLSAIHNLSADNLTFADSMGGLSVPSIGIVTDEAGGIDGFGEITLIGGKSLADPKKNPVYSSDAYTARFPSPEYNSVKSKDAMRVVDEIREVAIAFDDRSLIDMTYDEMVNRPKPDDLVRRWLYANAAKAAFLREQGITVKPVMEPAKPYGLLDIAQLKEIKPLYDRVNKDLSSSDMIESYEYKSLAAKYQELIQRRFPDIDLEMRKDFGAFSFSKFGTLERDFKEVGKPEYNKSKTSDLIDKKMNPKREAAFKAWVEAKLLPAYGEPYLTVKRKKVPYTLENIVQTMTAGGIKGTEETMTYGAGNARAAASVKFKTLEQMRKLAETSVADYVKYENIKEESEKLLERYRDAVIEFTTIKNWKGEPDTWEALDSSMRAIAQFATGGKTKQALISALRRNDFDVDSIPNEVIDLGVEAGNALINAPVPYFEAKPQRAVSLDEFKGAVIPQNASAKTKAILKKYGIKTYTYTGESDRVEAVRNFTKKLAEKDSDVLFSKSKGKGTGTTIDQVQQWIHDDIFSHNVTIYPTLADAPTAFSKLAFSRGFRDGDIHGFYDRKTNSVGLVASGIRNKAHAIETARHELIGHYGIETLLGDEFRPLLARVKQAYLAKNPIIYKLGKEVEAKQPGLSSEAKAAEIIAFMAERNMQNSIARRAINAIRKFLKEIGFIKGDITDAEIADLLREAQAYLRKQGRSLGSKDGEFAFSANADRKPVTVDTRDNWLFRRDALGNIQLAPTGKAYDVIAEITQNIANKANFGMASPELRKLMRKFKADMQKALDVGQDVAQGMSKMSAEDRVLISDVVEKMVKTNVVPPAHVLNVAANIQGIMDKQTDELVTLGMLSNDAAERWRGKYLPRFYNREKDPALNTFAKKLLRTALPIRGLGGGSLKGRGLYKEINIKELPDFEALGWEVRDPLWKKNRQGKLELNDESKIRDPESVMIWRDYTPEERENMGEMRDSMFRFVMGYTAMQNDIALGRLFDGIAKNQEWTRSRASEGYTKVPDSEIAETGGVKKYGNLAGLYVRDDIMQHITQYEEAGDMLKYYRKALSFWKMGKTVLNPVSHLNNMVSNLSMAHFAGVSYWDTHKYVGALRDFVQGNPMIDEAKDVGLMTGDITRAELIADMPDDIKALMDSKDSSIKRGTKMTFNLFTFGLTRPMSKAYRFEDDFFKYLIYKEARAKGLEPDDAVDYATKYIFNYDDLPKSARFVRDAAIPFFAYTYKAVPALAYTAFNTPWRLAAPALVLSGINAIAYGMIAGDDDDDLAEKYAKGKALEEEERKNLPPWMQGKSALGTPKSIRLGTDEVTGLPIYNDVSRFIPGGDMFDVGHGEMTTLPAPITPSNPIFTTFAALMPQVNRDTFTGKDVVDKNDTAAEAAKKRASWLIKQISPAIAPTGYHADRLLNAGAQMADTTIEIPFIGFGDSVEYTGFGKDGLPVQGKYAVMNTLGIKARPTDLELSAEISQGQDASLARTVKAEIRQAARMLEKGAITQRAYDKIEAEGIEKIDRLTE